VYQGTVFNSRLRRRYSLLLGVATFASALVPFATGVALLETLWPEGAGPGPPLTVLGALALAALCPWQVQNRLGLIGNRALRLRLWERVRGRLEQAPAGIKPVFVGFSPGDQLLTWDGDTDQDVGFLAAWGDSLVYFGDRHSWHLSRERIDGIEPLQHVAGLKRIVIRWHAPRESNRSFTLVSREATHLRAAERATSELLNQLYAWTARPPAAEPQAPFLGLPPTDASDGTPLDAAPGGTCAAVGAVALITVLAAWYVAAPMATAGRYYRAVLWAGGIAVLGATAVNFVLRLLQWAETADRTSSA
jgi:hypothetical protein